MLTRASLRANSNRAGLNSEMIALHGRMEKFKSVRHPKLDKNLDTTQLFDKTIEHLRRPKKVEPEDPSSALDEVLTSKHQMLADKLEAYYNKMKAKFQGMLPLE